MFLDPPLGSWCNLICITVFTSTLQKYRFPQVPKQEMGVATAYVCFHIKTSYNLSPSHSLSLSLSDSLLLYLKIPLSNFWVEWSAWIRMCWEHSAQERYWNFWSRFLGEIEMKAYLSYFGQFLLGWLTPWCRSWHGKWWLNHHVWIL